MKGLDMDKIKDKRFEIIPTEEALKDVEPFIPFCNYYKTFVSRPEDKEATDCENECEGCEYNISTTISFLKGEV